MKLKFWEREEAEIPCLPDAERIGSGMYRDVYQVGDYVCKVNKEAKTLEEVLENHRDQEELRQKFSFLPSYYGTIYSWVKEGEELRKAGLSFYERVEPITYPSVANLEQMFLIFKEAWDKGYSLDLKPRNFGKRDSNELVYLDEGGISKGKVALPKDVARDFEHFKDEVFKGPLRRCKKWFLEMIGKL